MVVTHIYHSGFLVELSHALLLFDYYQGSLPVLIKSKPLYVFVSHKHFDHFSPLIWQLNHPNITYILFEDVPLPPGKNAVFVAARGRYHVNGLMVETFRSTDEGCAFAVTAEKKTLYHAGDLNWWHWEGEPAQDNEWHDKAFHEELELLRGKTFDCAFLVLDPRQEENAWWGFAAFLNACPCRRVFPMHYENNKSEMLAYLALPQLQTFKPSIITQTRWCDEEGE